MPRKFFRSLFATLGILLLAQGARAQHDNPTGPAGTFGPQSQTGCSFSPYSANAARTITDISVSGGVSYPLQWSRTMNSRQTSTSKFGSGGGWSHSYNWKMDPSEEFDGTNAGTPSYYMVYFPDGRAISFDRTIAGDPGYFHGPVGLGERFQALNLVTKLAFLVLPDGGKVEFRATKVVLYDPEIQWYTSYWTYQAQALIDPNGLRTVFSYLGSSLDRITEPAGRYLQLSYTSGRISRVDAKYGAGIITQSVTYTYATQSFGGTNYTVLTSANYLSDPGAPAATYSYQPSNMTANGTPLIWKCNDIHYAGPMKSIWYDFDTNPSTRFYGKLLREKHIGGTNVVVTLSINGNSRTETRGDVPTRTFSYAAYSSSPPSGFTLQALPYVLADSTDFKGNKTFFSYDSNGYLNKVQDPRGAQTTFNRLALTGNTSSIQFPVTAPSPTPTMQYAYQDSATGYYLSSVTNERNYATSYQRDSSQRLTRVDYPDGAFETWTYNSFNQALTQQKTTGGTWTYTYDTRGNMTTAKTPYNETTTYGYDANDRASTVQDARNNTTNLTYDARGRLTQLRHPAPDLTTKRWQYNTDNTLQYEENELGQRINYTYDDYKRVRTVANHLGHTAQIEYFAPAGGSTYSHTSGAVRKTISPLGVVTGQTFDDNFRVLSRIEGEQDAVLAATTSFQYDGNGNVTKVTDPRGKVTDNTYDPRNRILDSTKYAQITRSEYDAAGNVTKIKRPDNTEQLRTYDSMNRVLTDKDPLLQTTTYTYWPSGLVKTVMDPKNQTTQLDYDLLGRKIKSTFPNGDYQEWTYDPVGNVLSRQAVNAAVQSYVYDNRNRPTSMSWSNGVDFATYGYDVAGRLTSANNPNSNVTLAYDAAGRLTNDMQNVTGFGSYDVQYTYDSDGRLTRTVIPSAHDASQSYDARGRLWKIYDPYRPDMLEYTYDAASNVTQRKNYLNNSTLDFPRDDFNRPSSREVKFGASTISSETYGYDLMNRMLTVDRTEDSKRDGFGYDLSGQLTSAQYGLVGGINPQRSVSYTLDPAGNRTSVVDAGVTKSYTPNNLNHYSTGHSQPVSNGTAHEISGYSSLTYTYLNDERLVSVTGNGNTYALAYDALGRTVKRTINGATTYYFYQGAKPIIERGATVATNIYGLGVDEIAIRFLPTDVHYFYQDRLGSVTHVGNLSGSVAESYRYDAFGAPTIFNGAGGQIGSSAIGNRFMFTGREWAPASLGFYEYRARAYNPTLGRFMSEDPIGFSAGDTNLFRYCAGDPVNRSDPSGLQQHVLIKPLEATTPPVTVSANPVGVPGVGGWVNLGAGMPSNFGTYSTLSGGSNRFGGIGNGRVVTATRTKDSNQLGVTRSQPFASSTQGWWTTLDGLPTGSPWVITLLVQSAIEQGLQSSIKSLQSLTFNSWGQIVSHWGFGGSTNLFGLARVPGSAIFSASVWSAGGQYLANMTGKAWNFVGNDPIDYSFNFSGTFGGGAPTLSGAHDGYPSYSVFANGQSLYYRPETGSPWGPELADPMEIIVGR